MERGVLGARRLIGLSVSLAVPLPAAAALLGLVTMYAAEAAQQNEIDSERGSVVARVVTRADPGQSYALYLPSRFERGQRWPLVLVFDPAARGRVGVEPFVEGAERLGYVVACSNNARNGPWEPILAAARAMWVDVTARLPIDSDRVYGAGFSGGARVASMLGTIVGHPLSGVIGCGAGLAQTEKSVGFGGATFYGIVGRDDFNFRELMALDRELDRTGVPHAVRLFDGGHRWPPPPLIAGALEWMEVRARRARPSDSDEATAKAILERRRLEAEDLAQAGELVLAARAWDEVALMFGGWRDSGPPPRLLDQAKAAETLAQWKRDERLRGDREAAAMAAFEAGLRALETSDAPAYDLPSVLSQMALDRHRRRAKSDPDSWERALGRRVLGALAMDARAEGGERLREGDAKRAAVLLEVAVRASEELFPEAYRSDLFNLACVQARLGHKKAALKTLGLSVAAGFDRAELLEGDADLSALRGTPEFEAILVRARANAR
jgi:hypothetical protein